MAIILFARSTPPSTAPAPCSYVPLSIRLGTGADGYGYLLAGSALGGVLGAGLANRLSGAGRLAPVIMGSICLQALPFLVPSRYTAPVLAAVLQVVSGVGMVIVDVLALTSLQRDLPGAVLSRVLGIFDTVVLGGILLASLATGILLAHAGVIVALVAVGAGIPAVALVGLPALLRADRTSARPPPGCGPGSACCPGSTCWPMRTGPPWNGWPRRLRRSSCPPGGVRSARATRPTRCGSWSAASYRCVSPARPLGRASWRR